MGSGDLTETGNGYEDMALAYGGDGVDALHGCGVRECSLPFQTYIPMKITSLFYALTGLSLLGVTTVSAAPKPVIKAEAETKLPEIWQSVPASQRLSLVRAAEMDALRILAERIAGLALDGESTVRDLAATSNEVRGELEAVLRGVKTTEGPTYHEDGRVEVVRAVKVAQLIRSLTQKNGGTPTASLDTREDTMDALGNAAIPGSPGQKRIMAKRAAEMDVYRRLAERVAGVHITGDTTLKDFVAKDDKLRTSFNHTIKSAEITSIVYNEDGTATVEATLKIGPLVRTIVRHKSAQGVVLKVEEKTEQQEITETGNGAPAEDASDDASAPSSQEVEAVISSILAN